MTREELLKTAKPILFNTEMVRAILDGRKSVTRRVVKGVPNCAEKAFKVAIETKGYFELAHKNGKTVTIRPPYNVGDILYVRETWCKGSLNYGEERYFYKVDGTIPHCEWSPSIHMPKEAARIFLRVKSVRVERLQDITVEQAIKEGTPDVWFNFAHKMKLIDTLNGVELPNHNFIIIWNSTAKKSDLNKYGWDANPWVWVIEFERVEVTGGT